MRFNKIFGIGLPRTGTTSLHRALCTLGLPSIHFPFDLYTTSDDSLLDQYTCFLDAPIPLLYKTLDQAYPGSGFILTTRSLENWLRSMEWLLTEGPAIWPWRPEYDLYHSEFFGSAHFDANLFTERYIGFHEDVSRHFQSRDDLLILNLDANYGYRELCDFLRIDLYAGEYPFGNSSRQPSLLQKAAQRVGKYSKNGENLIRRADYYAKRLNSKLHPR